MRVIQCHASRVATFLSVDAQNYMATLKAEGGAADWAVAILYQFEAAGGAAAGGGGQIITTAAAILQMACSGDSVHVRCSLVAKFIEIFNVKMCVTRVRTHQDQNNASKCACFDRHLHSMCAIWGFAMVLGLRPHHARDLIACRSGDHFRSVSTLTYIMCNTEGAQT